jgi:hypothetical protein
MVLLSTENQRVRMGKKPFVNPFVSPKPDFPCSDRKYFEFISRAILEEILSNLPEVFSRET